MPSRCIRQSPTPLRRHRSERELQAALKRHQEGEKDMRNALTAIAVLAASWSVPSHAQSAPAPEQKDSGGSILDKAINKVGANWAIYGAGQTNKMMKEEGVPG